MKNRPARGELNTRRMLLAFLFSLSLGASASPKVDPLVQLAELTASDGVRNDALGFALAISGNTVVAGDPQSNAAYVFTKPTTGWANMTQVAKLTASDGGFSLGGAVAISGGVIAVGAAAETVGANIYQGAVYVFVEPAGGWKDMTETAKLTALNGTKDSKFGQAVSIIGDTLLVGAPFAPHGGLAYVYVKPRSGWSTTSKFNARLTPPGGNWFGSSVAVGNGALVVGAPEGGSIGQGVAYVFVRPAIGWRGSLSPSAALTASDGLPYDEFGVSVSFSGNTVVAGATEDSVANPRPGAAYVFVEPAGGWTDANETAELTPSDGKPYDLFGCSVTIVNNTLVVGASGAAIGSNLAQGAAYVFERPSTGWATTSTFYDKLTNSDGAQYDSFGFKVALSGESIVASSPEWPNGAGPGAAYVFGP